MSVKLKLAFFCHICIVPIFEHMGTQRCHKPTYAVAVLVEGQGAVPRVQMHADDRALTEPRGELHFVPFVLEQTFEHTKTDYIS